MSEPLIVYLLNGYVPDRALLPNRRNSVVEDSMLRGIQRRDVGRLIAAQRVEVPPDLPERLWCRITVGWPKYKRFRKTGFDQGEYVWRFRTEPDPDNLNSACKGALDAVADALGRDDKLIDLLPPVQRRDEHGEGWMLVEIGGLE